MNRYLTAALVVALLTIAGSVAWIAHRISVMSRKTEELTATSQQTMTRVYEYVDWQLEDFQSPAYQKRLQATVATGAYIGSMANSFNRLVIPEIRDTFRYLRDNNLVSLNATTLELRDFVKDTSHSINKELVPEVVARLHDLGATQAELTDAVKEAKLGVQGLQKIANNPDIPDIIAEMKGAAIHFNATTGHIEGVSKSADEGMTKFPDLMSSFQKYARASTVWQKRLYLAMIIRQLAAIPLRLP